MIQRGNFSDGGLFSPEGKIVDVEQLLPDGSDHPVKRTIPAWQRAEAVGHREKKPKTTQASN